MNSTSLCGLAGRYDNHIPPRLLAPIDCLKIPALLVFSDGEKTNRVISANATIRMEVIYSTGANFVLVNTTFQVGVTSLFLSTLMHYMIYEGTAENKAKIFVAEFEKGTAVPLFCVQIVKRQHCKANF
jgi:hypothetical protein